MQNIFGYGLIALGLIAAVAGNSLDAQWFYVGAVIAFLGVFFLIAGGRRKQGTGLPGAGSASGKRRYPQRRSSGGDHDSAGRDSDDGDGD